MDILNDLAEIVKDDRQHRIRVEINDLEMKVFMIYDPDCNYDEELEIPIVYTTLEEFAYIPQADFCLSYNEDTYGLDLEEIRLIEAIMEYMQAHGEDIKELCEKYSIEYRGRNYDPPIDGSTTYQSIYDSATYQFSDCEERLS